MMKKLYIEPTSKCNLNCKMCFRHTWFDETYCDMSINMFNNIINTLPKTVSTIFFGGMGEPLFHKEIIYMIKSCHSLGVSVELLTNGTLLSVDMCENLISNGLNRIWISIDELSSKNNNGVGHGTYLNTIKNIEVFNTVKRKMQSEIKLGITFVATKSNVSQLAQLPVFLDKYQISDVNISNVYPSDKESMKEALYEKTLDMSIGSDVYGHTRPNITLPYMDFNDANVQNGLNGLFSHMNFNLSIGDIKTPRKSNYCRFVNEGMCFIRSDGNVTSCMALLHNGTTYLFNTPRTIYHHSFGNILENGLEEIWNNEEFTSFRKRVIDFSFSPCTCCGICPYGETNESDCFGNQKPTCGACLWAEGLLSCP